MELIGGANETYEGKEALKQAWIKTLDGAHCKHPNTRITYESFRLLMKGQTSCKDADSGNITNALSSHSTYGLNGDSALVLKLFETDSRRALALPERSTNEDVGVSRNSHALNRGTNNISTNRNLYRSHRQMRLFVLEATRRLEEDQTRRARQAVASDSSISPVTDAKINVPYKIGVRSGKQKESKEEKTSNSSNVTVQAYLVRSQVEDKFRIDKAAMRGGRKIISHASNKMTMSDVSWISRPSESSLSHSGSVCWQRRNNPPYRHKESSL